MHPICEKLETFLRAIQSYKCLSISVGITCFASLVLLTAGLIPLNNTIKNKSGHSIYDFQTATTVKNMDQILQSWKQENLLNTVILHSWLTILLFILLFIFFNCSNALIFIKMIQFSKDDAERSKMLPLTGICLSFFALTNDILDAAISLNILCNVNSYNTDLVVVLDWVELLILFFVSFEIIIIVFGLISCFILKVTSPPDIEGAYN